MGKTTPTAEQRRLVALWRGSTLSKTAFARTHGVLPGTFASWVARHDTTPTAPPMARSFVEVAAVAVASSRTAFIVYVDDHALRFEVPPPPAWFAAVLRELAPC
jgi:hypothetical protein